MLKLHPEGDSDELDSAAGVGQRLVVLECARCVVQRSGEAFDAVAGEAGSALPFLYSPQTMDYELCREGELHLSLQDVVLEFEPILRLRHDVEDLVVAVSRA